MKQIQFISVTPEQLETAIIKGVKTQLDEFKKNFEPKTPTVYMSRKEVAKMLKVDLSTINNWRRRNVLKSYGISGRVYYKRSEIENAIIELKK